MAKPCLLYCGDGVALCGRGEPDVAEAPAHSVPLCSFLTELVKQSPREMTRRKQAFCPACVSTLRWAARARYGAGTSR